MNDRNRLRTLSPSPASPPPLSCFVSPFLFPFSPLFVSYSDLRANSIPVARSHRVVLRFAHAKTQFHPTSVCSPSFSFSLRLYPFHRRLSPFQFYIVSIVVVTSRRFDYAPHSTRSRLFFAADSAANHDHVPGSK